MGEVEEVPGLVFYLLPCSECLYLKALARFLGGWVVSAIQAAARPLFLSGVLPASRRWGIHPR